MSEGENSIPAFMQSGGPAFPQKHEAGDGSYIEYFGLTVRDYFAANAPITLVEAVQAADLESGSPSIEVALCRVLMDKAKRAIAMTALATLRNEYADAMLKTRES